MKNIVEDAATGWPSSQQEML